MKIKFRKLPLASLLSGLTIPRSKQRGVVEVEKLPSSLAAMFEHINDEGIPVFPVFTDAPKSDQLRLVKTIGQRMREARELCNMSQIEAARRLNYANSSKLAKIENASDTDSVPIWLIARAAQLYDVSTDFLFRLTDDWESDGGALTDRDVGAFLLRQWESARARDLDAMAKLYARVKAVAGAIDDMVNGSNEVAAALRSVRERSDDFDSLPAGNRLLSAIEKQAETARKAEGGLRRFKAELVGKAISAG